MNITFHLHEFYDLKTMKQIGQTIVSLLICSYLEHHNHGFNWTIEFFNRFHSWIFFLQIFPSSKIGGHFFPPSYISFIASGLFVFFGCPTIFSSSLGDQFFFIQPPSPLKFVDNFFVPFANCLLLWNGWIFFCPIKWQMLIDIPPLLISSLSIYNFI